MAQNQSHHSDSLCSERYAQTDLARVHERPRPVATLRGRAGAVADSDRNAT
jgi:hypothetical protein